VPSVRFPGLVVFAFLPQWFAFYQSRWDIEIPDRAVQILLITSQLVLFFFIWVNRKQAGFLLLGVGLLLNFAVIVANGGWMPISPDTVRKIYPNVPETAWEVGERLGSGKDIVLDPAGTQLEFLADRFTPPTWIPYAFAYSFGDVVLALGAIGVLWSQGGPEQKQIVRTRTKEHQNEPGI
jgi:hypothetical protein